MRVSRIRIRAGQAEGEGEFWTRREVGRRRPTRKSIRLFSRFKTSFKTESGFLTFSNRRLTIKSKQKKLISKKYQPQNRTSNSPKTLLINNEFQNSLVFLKIYSKQSLFKLIAICRNHVLKKFNIHNKKTEKIHEHRFKMRPCAYSSTQTNLFVRYDRIQHGLVEIYSLRSIQRVGQFSPFSSGMLAGVGLHSSAVSPGLTTSNELPLSLVSSLWNSVYCFDSAGVFIDFDWDQGLPRRSFDFHSKVLDSCENKHGLFVLTEDMRIFQDVGCSNAESQQFDFQVIANFDSELAQQKIFTRMSSYLDDFLLISIGTFFVLFGICEAKANMIDLGGVVRDFRISEHLHQGVLLVDRQAVVISLEQNKVLKKIDTSSTLKAISLVDNYVVLGGFNKKIEHFRLDKFGK